MRTARQAFLKAINNFPRWMDIRKRKDTSIGGKLLLSYMEEHKDFQIALEDYIDSYFLINYIGKEHEILERVYIVQVGDIDISTTRILNIENIGITDIGKIFYQNTKSYCLYQNGYLIISIDNLPEDRYLNYEVDGYFYTGTFEEKHLWNIFDEFALFLGLTRFDGENNKFLLNRCLQVFQNPANSTETGIKNVIINSIANYVPLSQDDIIIEKPNNDNIYLNDADGELIYDKLASLNQDIFRTKIWDVDTWEHNFKTSEYLPHTWDEPISVYQDGTGQLEDLKITYSQENNLEETTDVEITGYKEDLLTINEYVHKANIKRKINLKLKKYNDTLIPINVKYKITASDVKEINPKNCFIEYKLREEGVIKSYLEDVIINSGAVTVIDRGILPANKKYKLKFKPAEEFCEMYINKVNYLETGKDVEDLIVETANYKKENGTLRNVDVLLHANTVKELNTMYNLINCNDGITLGATDTKGEFSVDLSGMGGKFFKIDTECQKEDITLNTGFVKIIDGFTTKDDSSLWCDGLGLNNTVEIDIDCSELSFEFAAPRSGYLQGSCNVTIEIDDILDPVNSGIWPENRIYSKQFNKLVHAHVTIKKLGMHPIEIKNIQVTRYSLEYKLDEGEFIKSSFGELLPNKSNNVVRGKLVNYGRYSPVIRYIHVGASMKNASYIINNIGTGSGGILKIDTNCIVELYEVPSSGPEILIDSNYITKNIYRNDTSDYLYLSIDIRNYESVLSSSPKIHQTTKDGDIVNYIELKPGEQTDSITIKGIVHTILGRDSIYDILKLTINNKVYVCKEAPGFIVVDKTNNDEYIVAIPKSYFPKQAEIYDYIIPDDNVMGIFVVNDLSGSKSNTTNNFKRNFQTTYLTYLSDENFIATNEINMLNSSIEDIKLVNTFFPPLDTNLLKFYTISEINNKDFKGNATFKKIVDGTISYTNWSLGLKPYGIKIDLDINYSNAENYDLDTEELKETFVVSNIISLENKFYLDEEEIDLSRYIITPPEELDIIYSTDTCGVNIIIEEDGFNKLYHSNITSIIKIQEASTSNTIPPTDYSLMQEEGIIVWNTNKHTGKEVTVMYSYKIPKSLKYKSLSSLYSMVEYSVNAYKKINNIPIVLSDLSDDDVRVVEFPEDTIPDKVVIKCSNSNFKAYYSDQTITVNKINDENIALLKAGFYYDEGDEYYFFADHHQEIIDRLDGVEMHNVKRLGNSLIFSQASKNYIKNSAFITDNDIVVCEINCKDNDRIKGISNLKTVTPCDVYNMWSTFNMNVDLRIGINGLGIGFEPYRNEVSYAVMDISHIIEPNIIISLATSKLIEVYLMKEILAGDSSMRKSIHMELYKEFESEDIYRQVIIPEDVNTDIRYYLLVKGSGMIDDIIAKPYIEKENPKDLHVKNIKKLNFNIETSKETQGEWQLDFDPVGNLLNGLDIAKDNTIMTGSSVDWDITKIYDIKNDISKCTLKNCVYENDAFYGEDKAGYVTTPIIYLESAKSIKSLYIKINDSLLDKVLRNFNITVYTANSRYGTFKEIAKRDKTNLIEIPSGKLEYYVKIKVEVPAKKVINSIECYAKYVETNEDLHITVNNQGTLTTKIFDTTNITSYRLKKINGIFNDIKNTSIYVRGLRYSKNTFVFTEWYEEKCDSELTFVNSHTFEDYHLFQFKIKLNHKDAECKINNFIMEAVK